MLSSAILRTWDGHIYNPMVSNKPIMTPIKHREHIYGGMKTREPIVILLKSLKITFIWYANSKIKFCYLIKGVYMFTLLDC